MNIPLAESPIHRGIVLGGLQDLQHYFDVPGTVRRFFHGSPNALPHMNIGVAVLLYALAERCKHKQWGDSLYGTVAPFIAIHHTSGECYQTEAMRDVQRAWILFQSDERSRRELNTILRNSFGVYIVSCGGYGCCITSIENDWTDSEEFHMLNTLWRMVQYKEHNLVTYDTLAKMEMNLTIHSEELAMWKKIEETLPALAVGQRKLPPGAALRWSATRKALNQLTQQLAQSAIH